MNKGADRIEFTETDIRDFEVTHKDERFDHVMCNPPFLEAGTHLRSPDEGKAIANGHILSCHSEQREESRESSKDPSSALRMTIQDWLDAGFRLLKPGGSLTLIHRADALGRILQGLGRRFGAVEIIPLWPRSGEEAKRVIIRARKDRKTPVRLHAGLVLHEANGDYTDAAEKILRGGQAIV